MITVYRIENPDGTGPYRGTNPKLKGFIVDISQARGFEAHPNPHGDMGDIIERITSYKERKTGNWMTMYDAAQLLMNGRICGFRSIQQLKDWFRDEDLACMSYYGAVLVEYHLKSDKDIHFGKKQVLFRYKNKKKIKHNICEYFNLQEKTKDEVQQYKDRQFEQTFE